MARKKRDKVDELISIYWLYELKQKTGLKKQKDVAEILNCDARAVRFISSGSRSPRQFIHRLKDYFDTSADFNYFYDIYHLGPVGLPLWMCLRDEWDEKLMTLGNLAEFERVQEENKNNVNFHLWLELIVSLDALRSHKKINSILVFPYTSFVVCLLIIKCLYHQDLINDEIKRLLVITMLEKGITPFREEKLSPIAIKLPFRYFGFDISDTWKKVSPTSYSQLAKTIKSEDLIPPNPLNGSFVEGNIWNEMGIHITEEDWLRM